MFKNTKEAWKYFKADDETRIEMTNAYNRKQREDDKCLSAMDTVAKRKDDFRIHQTSQFGLLMLRLRDVGYDVMIAKVIAFEMIDDICIYVQDSINKAKGSE